MVTPIRNPRNQFVRKHFIKLKQPPLTSMFGDLLESLDADVFMRKVLEYLLCSLGHVSSSSEDESQRANGLGHHSQGYFVACVTNGLSRHFGVTVVMCRSNMLKDNYA